MTARSFTEAFTETPEPVDLNMHQLRIPVGALIAELREVRAARDSARSIAAALQGQLAKIQQVCDRDAKIRRECAASDDCTCAYKNCYEHGKWHDCTCGPLGPIRAALTGGEDDARA